MRVAVVSLLVIIGLVTPAVADGEVESGSTAYFVGVNEQSPDSATSTQSAASGPYDPVVATIETVACDSMRGDQTCAEPLRCDDGTVMVITTLVYESGRETDAGSSCPSDAVVGAPEPELTPGMVAAAFRRIPLPESELSVQPPNGRTLVNFDTNFFTEDTGEFTRTVTLLGRRVELRIWPSQFGWRFGDGETTRTTSPGSAYPELEITHRYLEKGRVSPSVDTTYAAQFRVGGGPWRDVQGTVTIPGTPEGLRVVTARPVLVGAASD